MKMKRKRRATIGVGVLAVLAGAAGAARAQELADFDYENLSFRGLDLSWSYLHPSRVEPTTAYGLTMDLGYLGPGLRIEPGILYWSSDFKRSEVAELEDRVAALIRRQLDGPPLSVDLGTIEWSDVALTLDAHVVWRVPYNVLTFAGLGGAVHFLNGSGEAIAGTFVEDLLDSVTAGFNLHTGLEVPVHGRFRLSGVGRYEVLGDLQYFQLGIGAKVMIRGSVPGEEVSP